VEVQDPAQSKAVEGGAVNRSACALAWYRERKSVGCDGAMEVPIVGVGETKAVSEGGGELIGAKFFEVDVNWQDPSQVMEWFNWRGVKGASD